MISADPAAQEANRRAWDEYYRHQAAAQAANAEAWRQYYAATGQQPVGGANAAYQTPPTQPGAAAAAHPYYAAQQQQHAAYYAQQQQQQQHAQHAQYQHQIPAPQPQYQHQIPAPASHPHPTPSYQLPRPPGIQANPSLAPGIAPRATLPGFRPASSQPMASTQGHAPAPAPQQPAASGGNRQWPPALKAFVERCFAACRADPSAKDHVQDELKRMINDASNTNTLWTRDWDRATVPRPGEGGGGGAGGGPETEMTYVPGFGYRPAAEAAAARPVVAQHAGGYGYGELSGGEDEIDEPGPPLKAAPQQSKRAAKRAAAAAGKGKKKRLAGFDEDDAPPIAAGVGGDLGELGDELTDAEKAKRAKRSGRFGDGATVGGGAAAAAAAAERKKRMESMMLSTAGTMENQTTTEKEQTWDALTIKGTCERLEKSYFRLTSAPDPATVRPQPVLEKSLARLKSAAKGESYHYLTDQLKALRQDCTVQRLRNAFTAEVYEHHARVALQNDDLGEFNQCQTVLKTLYGEGVEGEEMEFLAYRVLYSAVTGVTGSNINTVLATACAMRSHPAIAHALAVRSALKEDNAVDWFRLRVAAKKFGLGKELMDVRTEEVRFKHVTMMATVCKPTVPVTHLAHVLGFSGDRAEEEMDAKASGCGALGGERDGEETAAVVPRETLPPPSEDEEAACVTWLEEHGAVVVDVAGAKHVDSKESLPKLFVPEDKNAVAHGDQTLDYADFLASVGTFTG